jgi:hypothetical protein
LKLDIELLEEFPDRFMLGTDTVGHFSDRESGTG